MSPTHPVSMSQQAISSPCPHKSPCPGMSQNEGERGEEQSGWQGAGGMPGSYSHVTKLEARPRSWDVCLRHPTKPTTIGSSREGGRGEVCLSFIILHCLPLPSLSFSSSSPPPPPPPPPLHSPGARKESTEQRGARCWRTYMHGMRPAQPAFPFPKCKNPVLLPASRVQACFTAGTGLICSKVCVRE